MSESDDLCSGIREVSAIDWRHIQFGGIMRGKRRGIRRGMSTAGR